MKQFKIFFLTVLLVSIATSSWSAWWIFGASKDEVSISYMQLNGISFDELGEKVKVFKDTMENGEIQIKGKASAGKNKIALVEVSTDGQATWKPADLSDNGAYIFRFTPETDKTYKIAVKVSDTAGKTNNVSATLREVAVSPDNVRKLMQDALLRLIDAYQNKNATAFMANVSDKFVGDPVNLDRAIRRDFSLFDNITLSFTISNIISSGGKIAASINYNRSLYATRTNNSLRDQGITDFTFAVEGGQIKVASMKNPLIFGLSDASNVATGNSANGSNVLVLSVDENGVVSKVAFKDLGQTSTSTTDSSSNSIGTCSKTLHTYAGGDFDRLTSFCGTPERVPSGTLPQALGVILSGGHPGLYGCMTYKDLGTVPLTSVTASNVPISGYSTCMGAIPTATGHSYAMTNSDKSVKVVYVQSIAGASPAFTVQVQLYEDTITTLTNYGM